MCSELIVKNKTHKQKKINNSHSVPILKDHRSYAIREEKKDNVCLLMNSACEHCSIFPLYIYCLGLNL